MRLRFYVVVKGRKPGIYNQWEGGAKQEVDGFRGAVYKSFTTLEVAELWWDEMTNHSCKPPYHFDRTDLTTDKPVQVAGTYFTYLIVDPRTNLPFYVGQTKDLEGRKIRHLNKQNRNRDYKKVISEIQDAGLEPVFKIVDIQPTEADSLRSETECVKQLAYQGIRVLNKWREHKEWIEYITYPRE